MSAPRVDGALVAALFDRARGASWQLTPEVFADALERSLIHAFRDGAPSADDAERYVRSLHLEDLALACACAAGHEPAWDHFVQHFRPVLYRAADAIDATGGTREIADALYADLYGLDVRGGARQSLFRYFHGRSSLATWLRAVLAQRLVDARRSQRRLEPLADGDHEPPARRVAPADPEARRLAAILTAALAAAVAALPARDRLRLACYYAKDITLAAIGRQLGEHEATVSRHLARTRRDIRAAVDARLRGVNRLDPSAIDAAWRALVDDPADLDIGAMMDVARKDPATDRSKDKEKV